RRAARHVDQAGARRHRDRPGGRVARRRTAERRTRQLDSAAMSRSYLFSSESVTEGHPDKLADRISDSILDAMLREDPHSRVACETLVTTGFVMVSGEITTEGWV